jgi:anaerobic ribonucleoside-triphosphate reductase activating protein
VDGITFSGGHPLEPENLQECLYIALNIKQKYPDKTIWLYTGLTLNYEHFSRYHSFGCRGQNKMLSHLLNLCDVVVDGPYIESERDITLMFRGSRNQRLIDVKKTLENKEITLWSN